MVNLKCRHSLKLFANIAHCVQQETLEETERKQLDLGKELSQKQNSALLILSEYSIHTTPYCSLGNSAIQHAEDFPKA